MASGSSTRLAYQYKYGELDSQILGILCGEEIQKIQKQSKGKIKILQEDNYYIIAAKTEPILAQTKGKIDKMRDDIYDASRPASFTVQTQREIERVECYIQSTYRNDVVYSVSTSGKATIFRLYGKTENSILTIRKDIEKTVLKREVGEGTMVTAASAKTGSKTMAGSLPNKSITQQATKSVRSPTSNGQKPPPQHNTTGPSDSENLCQSKSDKSSDVDAKSKNSLNASKSEIKLGSSKSDTPRPPPPTTKAGKSDVKSKSVHSPDTTKSKMGLKPSTQTFHANASDVRSQPDMTPGSKTTAESRDLRDMKPPATNTTDRTPSVKKSQNTVPYYRELTVCDIKVGFMEVDITEIKVDAVVNAANEELSNGGGVALVIKKAAGAEYQRECDRITKKKKIPTTENVVTKAYRLQNCSRVINAVGPVWDDYPDKRLSLLDLALTVENILRTSQTEKFTSVAMPLISSGIYRFPEGACAAMYVKGILDFTSKLNSKCCLKEFYLVDLQDSLLDMTYTLCDTCIIHGRSINMAEVLQSLPRDTKTNKASSTRTTKSVYKENFNNDGALASATANTQPDLRCSLINTAQYMSEYKVGGKVNVKIYTCDMLDVKNVDVIVSAENRGVKGDGVLARRIAEQAGPKYKKELKDLVNTKPVYPFGEVLVTSAGKLKYKKVLHAIVRRFDDRGVPSEQELTDLKQMTEAILKKAENLNSKKLQLTSLAVPLLGTGHIKDRRLLEVICQAVFDGIFSFSRSPVVQLQHVHLVNISEVSTEVMKRVFDMETKERPRDIPHDNQRPKSSSYMRSHMKEKQLVAKWTVEKKRSETTDVLNEFSSKPGNLNIIVDGDDLNCVVCMDEMEDPIILRDCNHKFCRACITDCFSRKPACPMCNTVYGKVYGDQPIDGVANVYLDEEPLPGYKGQSTFIITYEFPDGKQTEEHPNPGKPYQGIRRSAYLPNTEEGQQVLHKLQRAFSQGLIFTIGYSRTTGKDGVLTWNDIHHKTRREGGPQRFGYPDPEYLQRVTEELAAKGIE